MATEKKPSKLPDFGARAKKALLARPRPIHVLLLVICFFLGGALVTQVRAQQTDPLERMSQQDLVQLLDELSAREETLRTEKADLLTNLAELQSAVTQQQAAAQAAEKSLTQGQINAAVVPVHGPGLTVTVVDRQERLGATHFVMALGELRNAGAEAASLNGIRITPRSWFASGGAGEIILDGTVITSPFVWQVIGDSRTIGPALEITGGSAQQMRAYGATVTIVPVDDVAIDVIAQAQDPQWAVVQ